MDEYYTAKDLAEMPGLPNTESAIIRYSKRAAWPSRKRPGRGGGREYSLSALPKETQDYIYNKRIAALPEKVCMLPALAVPVPVPVASLPDWQRDCMDARLALMRIIKAAPGRSVSKAIKLLVKAAASEILPEHIQAAIPLANARKGKSGERTLSETTLYRWWGLWKKSGFKENVLVPDRALQPRPEPVWAKTFLAYWKNPAKQDLTEVLSIMADELPAGTPIPSYSQSRRYLESLGMLQRETGRSTGKDLLSLKPYRRRLTDHMYPGDAYTADGHTFDGEVAHPTHGRPFRPEITPVLDIATRMACGWSIDLAESGLAVLDALRVACENFGPPVIFYTDNGKGYKNQMMTAPGTGILNRLGITPEYSRPRNPQAHGLSERAHKTILVRAAKQLCTYIGHAMDSDTKRLTYKATRAAVKDPSLPTPLIEWNDFVSHVNEAFYKYNNTPHRGLPTYRDQATRKLCHYTPAQMWALGIQRMQKDLPREYWLEPANGIPDLYHPAEERTADRGWVQLHKKFYYAAELANYSTEKVMVAFSPSDPYKVTVRNIESGRLICTAKLNGNSSEYFATSHIEDKREISANAKAKRLQDKLDVIELERRGPLTVMIDLPPEIEAKRLTSIPEPIEGEPFKTTAAIRVEEEPVDRRWQPPDERILRWKCWLQLYRIDQEGGIVQPEKLNFFKHYPSTPSWKAFAMVNGLIKPEE